MKTLINPERCTDDSITAHERANVNVNKITLPSTRDLVIGTVLAFSLLCSIFLYAYAKDAKTVALVANDALDKFMTNQLPALEVRIEVTEKLNEEYRKEIREYHNHQQSESEKAVGSDRRPNR